MSLSALMYGVAQEEGNNYNAIGKITKNGDRAYGKYQVMGENIPDWTKEALGFSLTPDQFRGSPQAQEAVAKLKLGQYLASSGSPAGAANLWFTGKANPNPNVSDANGTTAAQYAANVTRNMGGVAPAGRIDPSQMSDDADPLANATSALKNDAIANAAAGIAPKAVQATLPDVAGRIDPSALNDASDPLAAATKAITVPAQAVATQGDISGDGVRPMLTPTPPGTVINPPSDVVDRTQPITQQLATAGRAALGYGVGQVEGIPGAIAQDYRGATALNDAGNAQLNAGNALPSFPSLDPRTWSAGGIVNALGGLAGQVTAPITGATRQLVEQPVTEATGNPVAGEAAGLVANSLALPGVARLAEGAGGAVTNAALGGLDPETARLADLAQTKYGIPVTAPQLAGDTSMMKIGSNALDRLPFSGAAATRSAQMDPFNQAIAAEIGEPGANALTPDVMSAARTRIGNMFDTVAKNTTLNIDNGFVQDLHNVLNNAGQTLTQPEAALINKQAQNIIQKINPQTRTIDGATYQALTKTNAPLNALMNSENSNLSNAAKGLDNALDNVLARSASPEDQAMLAQARQQWAALKTIEPLAAKASTPGQISPGALSARVNAQTGNGMAYGWGGNLGELAQIGRRFLMEPGSSNTAERMTSLAAAGSIAGGAYRAATGAMSLPEAGMALGAIPAILGGGRAANALMRSRALSNALIQRGLSPAASTAFRPSLAPIGAVAGAGLLNPPVNALGAPNQ